MQIKGGKDKAEPITPRCTVGIMATLIDLIRFGDEKIDWITFEIVK